MNWSRPTPGRCCPASSTSWVICSASVNATLQASIAQHHGHNYGLAMALVAGTVAIVITVLTFFGREGRVIQSAGAGHHQPLSTSR